MVQLWIWKPNEVDFWLQTTYLTQKMMLDVLGTTLSWMIEDDRSEFENQGPKGGESVGFPQPTARPKAFLQNMDFIYVFP